LINYKVKKNFDEGLVETTNYILHLLDIQEDK